MLETYQYLGMLSYIITIGLLCGLMLFCGYVLGGRSCSRFKNVPFESGVMSLGCARIRFSVRFYLIAVIFVIFDSEGMYLYIWSASIRDTGWTGFIEAFIFMLILLVSLLYVIRLGLFNWINKSSSYYYDNKNG